jgi:hypothetical protein
MPLSLRQQKFVRAYLANGGVGSLAAKEANYAAPEVAAVKLLRLVKVQAAIRAHIHAIGVNPLAILSRVAKVLYAKSGVETRDRLQAAALLGKYCGLWTRHDRKLQRDTLRFAMQRAGLDNTIDFKAMVSSAERAAEKRHAERNGDGQVGADDTIEQEG